VVRATRANFDAGYDAGGTVAAFVDGEPVLDYAFGYVNDGRFATPYALDAIQMVFSSTKFVTSCVILHLIDRGLLEWDAPVAKYWPEFAQAGKAAVTVEDLLSHAGGVQHVAAPLATDVVLRGGAPLRAALAKTPLDERTWRQRGKQGYHGFTRGLYLNALCELVDPQHRTIEQYAHDEFFAKLGADYAGADDFRIGLSNDTAVDGDAVHRDGGVVGLPAHKALLGLLPRMFVPPLRRFFSDHFLDDDEYNCFAQFGNASSIAHSAFVNILAEGGDVDIVGMGAASNELRAMHSPSSHGFTNARSLARLAAVLAQGGTDRRTGTTVAAKHVVEHAARPYAPLYDEVLHKPIAYTPAGFGATYSVAARPPWVDPVHWLAAAHSDCVGWGGAGGSFVQFCPRERLSFAYVPNYYSPHILDWRGASLLAVALDVARDAA